jgi:HlyD family secretion protein
MSRSASPRASHDLPELGEAAHAELPLEIVERSPTRSESRPVRTLRHAVLRLVAGVALFGIGVVVGRITTSQSATIRGSVAEVAPDANASNGRVFGLGTLKPIGGVVDVGAPFGAGDARIATLRVKEGDRVEQGALLALLDNERALEAAVDSARATLAARTAAQGQVVTSVLASRAELRAQQARAETAAESAQREFSRAQELQKSGGGTVQALDQQRAIRDESQREVERLAASQARYGSGNVYSQTDAVFATRNIDIAKAELARAMVDREKAYVRAPIAGTILTIRAEAGERPGTRGIVSLGNIDQMKVEVDVYETQIARLRVNDKAVVRALALSKPLFGIVSKIGMEVSKQRTMDANPAANTDARVVNVTVALDAESSKLARAFTNLQVTTEFVAGEAK